MKLRSVWLCARDTLMKHTSAALLCSSESSGQNTIWAISFNKGVEEKPSENNLSNN